MKGYWADVKKLCAIYGITGAGLLATKPVFFLSVIPWILGFVLVFSMLIAGIANVLPGYKRTEESDE
jgi:hypothetical protein